ncbi:hypothetical protein KO561_04790 [Radiobacillus kanasensis]|uniref:hypothetical protein n=1 Tax=Radiobacillus kanasensis TaxID=2844358 RepID=UPI001E563996|nr:hypothetical protein [Radiobacillus kanasensis]UFU00273.1 hypothetical protein KO561_04790 [Radiobacillus kanasensis]
MLERKTLEELQEYVQMHPFIMEAPIHEEETNFSIQKEASMVGLEDYISENRKESFAEVLFSFIDKKEAGTKPSN